MYTVAGALYQRAETSDKGPRDLSANGGGQWKQQQDTPVYSLLRNKNVGLGGRFIPANTIFTWIRDVFSPFNMRGKKPHLGSNTGPSQAAAAALAPGQSVTHTNANPAGGTCAAGERCTAGGGGGAGLHSLPCALPAATHFPLPYEVSQTS